MFLTSAVCGPWQAHCYLIGRAAGSQCLLIDPGMDAVSPVKTLVKQSNLTPVAILATHGHIDHVASAASLGDHYGVPVWIHSRDRHLLSDPSAGLDPASGRWIKRFLPDDFDEPAQVEVVDGHDQLTLADLTITIIEAPGHTAGSVLYSVADPDEAGAIVFTGDVLFAGSVGRTDLPGGNQQAMLDSLRGPVLGLPDAARVFPGHGPASTIARERATNPYLKPAFMA